MSHSFGLRTLEIRGETNLLATSDGNGSYSPVYHVADIARHQPDGSIPVPQGYDWSSFADLRERTLHPQRPVRFPLGEAVEVAAVGGTLLKLDEQNALDPPLHPEERPAITYLAKYVGEVMENEVVLVGALLQKNDPPVITYLKEWCRRGPAGLLIASWQPQTERPLQEVS